MIMRWQAGDAQGLSDWWLDDWNKSKTINRLSLGHHQR